MILKLKSFLLKAKVKIIAITISALLLTGGALYVKSIFDENNRLQNRNEMLRTNSKQYESLAAGLTTDNRVLRLNRDDLRHSNDSLITHMEKVKESLRGAENRLSMLTAGGSTEISVRDTMYISNPTEFALDTTFNYNKLTSSFIKIEKDTIKSGVDVNNFQTLNVYSKEEYVNEYKNKWKRFWKFDWRKESVFRYEIKNDNALVKTTGFRVYKIEE